MPPFCYAFPVLLFLAFCIDRTGRKNNRIHITQKQSRKQTQRKSKSKAQAKRESVTHSNAITKQASKKRNSSTSKRACKRACYYNTSKTDHALINTIPRKAYKQTSKREKQSYTTIPCYYITVLLIYTYKHI